jgi:exopolysaccharide production protein ExoQ
MSKPLKHSLELGQARASTPLIDKCVIVPILVCAYVAIVSPLLMFAPSPKYLSLAVLMAPHPENKIFWPALAAISLVLAVPNSSRLARLTLPPNIICLLAYLALAGASVLWAFKPEFSFARFMLQVMIVTSIVLPAMLAGRTVDMMYGVFLCFAFALILNVFFVLGQDPAIYNNETIGYRGYFPDKNDLGQCVAIAFLLSLHEILYPGLRRALGIIIIVIAAWLIFLSMSKTSLAMGLIAPLLAGFTLIASKKMRISPAIVLLPIPICYEVLSRVPGLNIINRLSWYLFKNYTLSDRIFIWDFANHEIGRRPLLGWGYQSFWLVGPDAPSVVDAPGWIKVMPHAHNGYLDTQLEMGYVGLALLIIFIIATVHAIGRVADRDFARAWLLLSLTLLVILTNTLESTWMRGMNMTWVIFAIVAAEIARYWQPFRPDARLQYKNRFRLAG